MPSILSIHHIAIEPLGTISDSLEARDISVVACHPYRCDPVPGTLEGADGLIVMGGPMGANDFQQYPFLLDELRLIGQALDRELPILGVCLGSQLLATALGSAVERGERKEIGWHTVTPAAEAASDRLMSAVAEPFQGFHWHGDVFDLPADSVCLASSDMTACQAYSYEDRAYGFLFHMEVTGHIINDWLHHFRHELAETGQTAEAVQEQTRARLTALNRIGRGVYDRWADLVAAAR